MKIYSKISVNNSLNPLKVATDPGEYANSVQLTAGSPVEHSHQVRHLQLVQSSRKVVVDPNSVILADHLARTPRRTVVHNAQLQVGHSCDQFGITRLPVQRIRRNVHRDVGGVSSGDLQQERYVGFVVPETGRDHFPVDGDWGGEFEYGNVATVVKGVVLWMWEGFQNGRLLNLIATNSEQ